MPDTQTSGAIDVPEVYRTLQVIAHSYFREQAADHTLQATALVNEAFLKILKDEAVKRRIPYGDREHLIALATKAMRQVLVDHARTRNRLKRGGGAEPLSIHAADAAEDTPVDVLALHELLDRFAAMDPRAAQILEYRFFGGLTVPQVARLLNVSTFVVEQDWRAARAWLAEQLRGRLP